MAISSNTVVDLNSAMLLAKPELSDWLLVSPIVICLGGGAFLLSQRKAVSLQAPIAIFILLLLVGNCAALLFKVIQSGPIVMTMGRWLPPFGISFVADFLGVSFALMGSLVALFCAFYASVDVSKTEQRYGFFPFLILMMAGVVGAFLTGDIFNLYVWLEVLLIASFGLMILGSEKIQLDGAIKYAFLNLIGTTFFLIATGLLYGTVGTLNMADIAIRVPELSDRAPITTIAALYLVAFTMKAAAFPVFSWLPASYHTPKPVVSAVFAGLLTKVGIYALLRVLVMLLPVSHSLFAEIILFLGAVTMILGALGALAQTDIGRAISYLVISGIGMMFAGVGLNSGFGIAGTIFYAFHSMFVMAALFMASGIMQLHLGNLNLHKTGSLYRKDPLLSGVFFVLFMAIAGLPPFSGFWPKIILVKASFQAGSWVVASVILLTAFLTMIAVARIWSLAFWREEPIQKIVKKEANSDKFDPIIRRKLMTPLIMLCGIIVIMGIAYKPFQNLAFASSIGLFAQQNYLDTVFPNQGGVE